LKTFIHDLEDCIGEIATTFGWIEAEEESVSTRELILCEQR